jgi:hypothetical protein
MIVFLDRIIESAASRPVLYFPTTPPNPATESRARTLRDTDPDPMLTLALGSGSGRRIGSIQVGSTTAGSRRFDGMASLNSAIGSS